MPAASPLPPIDPDLTGAAEVFTAAGLRGLLGLPATATATAEIRYLEHEPGRSLTAQVRITDPTGPSLAAILLAAGADPVVVRYPDDTGLPGLAEGWGRLADRFDLGPVAPGPLAWVPGQRLVVAVGDRIVKLHADPAETGLAVATAAWMGEVVPVPSVLDVEPELAAHVQERVVGTPIERSDAVDAAADAATLLRRLRDRDPSDPIGLRLSDPIGLRLSDPIGLRPWGPGELVAACRPVVALVAFARPDLGDRVGALIEALEAVRPDRLPVVPSHGDFNVGQLLRRGDGELVVVDTDTLCAAPAALDPASYAANVVSGRPGDLDHARAVLDELVRAGGEAPPGLDWYLAAMVVRRLDRAIRRFKRRWPERTTTLVAAAEDLVDELDGGSG